MHRTTVHFILLYTGKICRNLQIFQSYFSSYGKFYLIIEMKKQINQHKQI